MSKALRLLWAAPCSGLGLAGGALLLALGGHAGRHGGALAFTLPAGGRAWRLLRRHSAFGAITLGHVILALDRHELQRLRTHEQVHVRQYERLGVFFLLAYPLASLAAWLRGDCPYRGNRFEVEAHAVGPDPGAAPACAQRRHLPGPQPAPRSERPLP